MNVNKKYLPPEPFVLMCSGGKDSVAAAHFLHSKGYKFEIFHFDQQYVPSDSLAAVRVHELANKLDYTKINICYSLDKIKKGQSIEAESRRLRYDALRQWNQKLIKPFKYAVTAHNLGDAVEGSLICYLRGHWDYCPLPVKCEYPEITIVRPFVLNSRREFSDYLHKNHLVPYVVEDPLNADTKLQRAWARHELIPMIEKRYKGLDKVVKKRMIDFVKRDLKF